MIDNVVINARALSIITAMADVPRDRLMAAHIDLDKYVYKLVNLNLYNYIHADAPDLPRSLWNLDPFTRLLGQLFDSPEFPNLPGNYLS